MFLHDALLEGLSSLETEIKAEHLGKHLEVMEAIDHEGESGYSKEFNVSVSWGEREGAVGKEGRGVEGRENGRS